MDLQSRVSEGIDAFKWPDHLHREMDYAKKIQMKLLNGNPPELDKGEVSGISLPARVIGGDYYDFFKVGPNKFRIIIGDVMGKGIPAAMLMILTRGAFRSIAAHSEGPGETLTSMNQALCSDLRSLKSFVTLFCADWDPINDVLTYANAGHNPPMHLSANGITHLKSKGIMLGGLPNQIYGEKSISLSKDEGVLFYTDGITEAQKKDGEFYTKQRLETLLIGIKDHKSDEIVQKILDSVDEFTDKANQRDDITMVMLKH